MAKSALLTVCENGPCPQCGVELVTRSGKHGPSLGCSHYSECDYTHPLRSSVDGHAVKILEGKLCPARGAELALRQGRFGTFIGCSDYSACDYTELIDRPDEAAIVCPQCRTGHLVQRCFRYGKTFYSCDRYPECQFVINFKPLAGEYPECHYPFLIEKKTAQGVKYLCAGKQCGRPISAE